MIPELMAFGALCVGGGIVLCCLAESGRLEDYSEKRHVDKLADKSRARKAPGRRADCSRWLKYNRP